MGLSFSNGTLLSSAYYGNKYKNEFASFVIDEDDNIFLDYFSNTITLTSKKSRKSIEVSEINKFPLDINDIVIYTPDWGEFSYGSSENRILTEFVVRNNKITKVLNNEPPVSIPKDGFVISAGGESADFLTKNFKLNSKVSLDINFNVDVDDIIFAVSGGAVLVKDGFVPSSFDSSVSGVHPRSAIGISKDEKTVYLVTVDGRQSSSVGMSQTDLAYFLLEIGCYNAINLDGGGSTSMVARKFGDNFLSTINSPSAGALRSVINAIGVTDSSPKSSKITNLEIVIDDSNVFLGEEVKVFVKSTNKYLSPIEIDQNDVKWSYDDSCILVKDGVVIGNAVGSTILKAKYGKVSTEIEINVLGSPSELSIYPKNLIAKTGVDYLISVRAKDIAGYCSSIDFSKFSWKIENYILDGVSLEIPSDVKLDNGVFCGVVSGEYIISVSYDNLKSYALVVVGEELPKSTTILPKDIKCVDSLNYSADLNDDKSFRFAIFDELCSPSLMIDYLRNQKVTNFINNNSDLVVFTSQKDNNLLNNFTVNVFANKGYSSCDFMNSTFISIDASNFGIRNSDSSQWISLRSDVLSSHSENIFLVMNNCLDNFSDYEESLLFFDVLSELKSQTGKNIWVIHKGFYTDYSMESGIKFIGINSEVSSTLDVSKNTNVVLVNVNDDEISYEIKNVFES